MDYPKSDPTVGLVGGKFSDGDPAGGVAPSRDPAAWANAVTDEFINAIIGGGLTPDELDNTQLAQLFADIRAAVSGFSSFKNKLVNGNFLINQRVVSGTVVLAAGAYGHDMFRAGAGGCTYTFATVNNVATLTITAGTLKQVIPGERLQNGTHTLSWTGTAQGRIDAGAYGPSGINGTAVGGVNQTCEWGTGTLSKVQYEPGSYPTSFDHRYPGIDLYLCMEMYEKSYASSVAPGSLSELGYRTFINSGATASTVGDFGFKVRKKTTPTTITIYSPVTGASGMVRKESVSAADEAATVLQPNENGLGRVIGVTTTSATPYRFHYTAEVMI